MQVTIVIKADVDLDWEMPDELVDELQNYLDLYEYDVIFDNLDVDNDEG